MASKMRMKAVYDCSADEPGELTFKEGDILVDVIKSAEEGWYEGRLENSSERGLFPYNYVELLPDIVETKPTTPKTNTPKPEEVQVEALNNFPTLDAFEAAMSQTRKGASNNSSIQNHKLKQQTIPTTAANSFPIIPKKEDPIGLGIKLKPTGLRQDIASRARSYSTPSTPNSNTGQDDSEKTVRPSQLRKDQGIQSTLSVALSKGPVSSSAPSGFKSSPKLENNSVPLVGLSTVKSISAKSGDTNDDEKLVKPSQLRNRNHFNKVETRPSPSIPASSPITTWKKNVATTATNNNNNDAKKIAIPEPNNPMPRLPSRPMSAATRKSRSSRTSSTNNSVISASPTKVKSDLPKTTPNLSPAKLESEKSAPPALKPKPNVAQPFLPPRPKLRSTSNPPPLQPKPFTPTNTTTTTTTTTTANTTCTTLEKPSKPPVKKTIPVVEIKTSTTPPPIAAKPSSVALKQNSGTTKTPPPIGSQKPVLPSRPSLDTWRTTEANNSTASDNDDDNNNKNIKPSQLFNRARSATSPSSPSKPMDWNVSPIAVAINSKNPEAQKKKKTTPPPPPPSRQPKNYANNNSNNNSNDSIQMDSAAKARYEILFDTINDEGFVDGETTQIIWRKSKLSDEDLARVWNDCDPDHKGLLDRESFIEGMEKIDEILSKQQHVL